LLGGETLTLRVPAVPRWLLLLGVLAPLGLLAFVVVGSGFGLSVSPWLAVPIGTILMAGYGFWSQLLKAPGSEREVEQKA
jgi:hypothetical protein